MKFVIQYFTLKEPITQNILSEDIEGATKELKEFEDLINKALKSNKLCNLGSGLLINPMNLLFMKLGHIEKQPIKEAEPING